MNNKGQYLVKKNVFKKGNPPSFNDKKEGGGVHYDYYLCVL